ncbi:hypothetical protein [Kribbella sp. NPDC050459]|uniref:hypothetical protein n=1 Tax=Kribbella sp. NPDC050459 TaxID=3155785 RepID=UPI0033C9B9ED
MVAYNLAAADPTHLIAGWQATLTAARHHFRWLRLELISKDFTDSCAFTAKGPFAALARSIGAGGDLLATQNRSTRSAFEGKGALAAARAEISSITGLAAQAVMLRLASNQMRNRDRSVRLLRHLVDVLEELEFHRQLGSPDIGALGKVATRLPPAAVDQPSRVILLAARWQSTHDATTPASVLSRDLRSTTAQLRTVIGYCLHLADLLRKRDPTARAPRDLLQALHTAGAATQRVTSSWRTRVSDTGGRSDGAAEASFVELLHALRAWMADGERLKGPRALFVDSRSLAVVQDVIDELMNSAFRVATVHQETVAWLVQGGRLYVPKVELAKRDPWFDQRPTHWRLKYPQPWWVRTNRASCFDQLSADLADLTGQLSAAAEAARTIAGTSDLWRAYGPEHFSDPPSVDRSQWRWTEPPGSIELMLASTDPSGPER